MDFFRVVHDEDFLSLGVGAVLRFPNGPSSRYIRLLPLTHRTEESKCLPLARPASAGSWGPCPF